MRRSFLVLLWSAQLSCRTDKATSETGEDPLMDDTEVSVETDEDQDGFPESEDCDDTDAEVNPDATEICDEIDNDCDEEVDEADAADAPTWYLDADDDGFGDESEPLVQCEAPDGFVSESKMGFDCDDSSAAFYPGADESDCTDPSDYNCDGSVAYEDVDADGWAACEECDDADPEVNPDATEICDEIDNDCDTATDDEDDSLDTATAIDWYRDADGDGFGDEDESLLLCAAPTGFVEESAEGFDCNDSDDAYYPGAEESDCSDPSDYNCDGSVAYEDADADGWAACEECDDADPQVNPDADEICNEIDDDCDGDVDDGDASVTGTTTWYIDFDGDGFGYEGYTQSTCEMPSGYTSDSSDCDDSDEAIHPDAVETCNELDDDCDGDVDDEDAEVTDTSTWYIDSDGDGYGSDSTTADACAAPSGYLEDDSDCDDTDAEVNPGATETCNGLDDDCDEAIDDDDSDVTDTTVWYIDYDGDGFGSSAYTEQACEASTGWVDDDTDCDDMNADVNPEAVETCNELDDDCDGDIDDDDSDVSGLSTWYADADADGFGDASESRELCDATTGYVADDTDCDDSDAEVNPDATETCNDVDDDCDGDIDSDDSDLSSESTTWYADDDGDGYGDSEDTIETTCSAPDGYVSDATDCDDDDDTAYDYNGGSSICPGASCLDILDAGHSTGDGAYWIDPDGSGAWEAYCDMTSDDGGWTLVGVAIYGNHGSSGWNDEASLNIGSSTELSAHWHLDSDIMNSLAASEEYRAACFDSNNNYTRYWWGVSDYNWSSLTSASESWDAYDRSGTSYATYWAAHHYGLVSGSNETNTLITAHTGHHWACGGNTGPGGEGYTGRGGNSSFRLWAK
jgi:hypothetical protein